MKKHGFTLIELLAVIVILAIIALIAIPTVMKVIENSKKGAVERSAENFINAAEQELAKGEMENNPIVDGSYTVTTESGSKYIVSDSDSNKKYEVKMNGTTPDDGSKLTVSGGKITGISNFTLDGYTIILNDKKQAVASKTVVSVWTTQDLDSSGTVNLGDLITVGTESFYVMSNNGTTIKALAQYNLYVGGEVDSDWNWTAYPVEETTGLQNSAMVGFISESEAIKGTIEYATEQKHGTSYTDYEGSLVKEYVDEYKTKLENLGATINSASLITLDELDELGCDLDNWTCSGSNSDAKPFVYSTSYWTRTAYDSEFVYFLNYPDMLTCDHYGGTAFGVRPVISISASEI